MIIAISQRVDFFPNRGEKRDSLDHRLIDWATSLNAKIILVPNALGDNLSSWLKLFQPTGVILSGGNDIGQFPERDITEWCLLDYAKEKHLPVLGICRGMQFLSTYFGVKLKPVEGHVATRHTVNIQDEIQGRSQIDVNSYHKFSLANCPSDFEVLAESEDGEIEAIKHKTLSWEGWMWHPERELIFEEYMMARARSLFK